MKEQALFGAGCFWGVEYDFNRLDGVLNTEVGYSGGKIDDPTYEDVCTGNTGHAEVVRIDYDAELISFDELLDAFWKMHNPTTLNRQGPDIGSQYRSVIFFFDEKQRAAAERSKADLDASKTYSVPIVTEISPAGKFWRAEEYHQKYFEKNGVQGCRM